VWIIWGGPLAQEPNWRRWGETDGKPESAWQARQDSALADSTVADRTIGLRRFVVDDLQSSATTESGCIHHFAFSNFRQHRRDCVYPDGQRDQFHAPLFSAGYDTPDFGYPCGSGRNSLKGDAEEINGDP